MIDGPHEKSWTEVVTRNAVLIVALLAIVSSIAGLRNGFALDDIEVIVKTPGLHTLAAPWDLVRMTYWRIEMGATLYRPMTMVVFAVQWVIGNGSPLVFHLTSIALYAVLSASVYRLAKLLMPATAAFAAAVVFAVHPVHVEAVANIVGQAEVWVALIVVLIVAWYIDLRRKGSLNGFQIAVMSAGYLLACSFKEHAIVLPLILLSAELLAVGDDTPLRARLGRMTVFAVAMGIGAGLFLLARYSVLHGIISDTQALILREQPFTTRFFTMLDVVLEWIRLFFWPMNLSADYSYPRIRTHTGFEAEMLPAVAVIAGVAWIAWTLRKRSPAATFGILWIAIAMILPSNLIFVTGFVLAERTLMLATVGFAICAGVGVEQLLIHTARSEGRARTLALAGLGAVVVAFAGRSMGRTTVWHDNATLINQTVLDVPSSHRAHWMRAVYLAENNQSRESLDEMDLAVALGEPKDVLLLSFGGDMFARAGRCPRALTLYRRSLALAPNNVQLRANTALCLINVGKLEEAKAIALDAGVNAGDERLQRLASASDSLRQVRSTGRAFR